jgi:hypothetical protein
MRATPGPPSKVGPGREPALSGGGDDAKPCARPVNHRAGVSRHVLPGRTRCLDARSGRAPAVQAGLRPSPMEARATGISGVEVRAARRSPLTILARMSCALAAGQAAPCPASRCPPLVTPGVKRLGSPTSGVSCFLARSTARTSPAAPRSTRAAIATSTSISASLPRTRLAVSLCAAPHPR